MNTSSRSFLQIRIIYVTTTLFLAALSVYTIIKLKNLTDSYELVSHSNQVTQSLQSVLTSIILAESNKRGFLLSGDSLLLIKRDSALHSLYKESQFLGQLISDNPRQVKNMGVLNNLIAEKVASILHNPLPSEGAIFNKETKYNTREGVSTMEKVTKQIDLMIATESTLLESRTGNSKQLSLFTSLFMISFFIGALLILWTSYLKLTNALFASSGLQQKLIVQNEEKEKRAAELVIANIMLQHESSEKEKRAAELVIANIKLLHESNEKENRAAELVIANIKLQQDNNEKEYRAEELIVANKELAFQVKEKEKRAAELIIANKTLFYESNEKEDRAAELVIANKELAFQVEEKEKRAAELIIANKTLFYESNEKEDRAAELVIANKELAFQVEEKENRAAELIIANKTLFYESNEKEDRAAELVIANKELAFQVEEKEYRAAELIIANKTLFYESNEKEDRAAELIIANKELAFQIEEKENRAAELIIANKTLYFESSEKEDRAAELIIANMKLLQEGNEKENRAAELVIANKRLLHESIEKENRAAELVIANEKLLHESIEKENRAAELVIANKELAYQVEEKEKRAEELISTNKELQLFAQIASHDLQEPLRKIQIFTSRIKEKDLPNISESGKKHFTIIEDAAERMQTLIEDLIAYAQTNNEERSFGETDLTEIINDVTADLSEIIIEKGAIIETSKLCSGYIIPFQFRQLMTNLISNSLKFSNPEIPCHIIITSRIENGNPNISKKLLARKRYCHISFSDNGIGFEAIYNEKIFEVFQRLHGKGIYKGTGIGLAIVKKIIDNHKGIITAVGKPNEGAKFDIYLPTK